ncbi:MAG: signal recognition particle-docking protein FtsY [Bacillota bacterium]|nr:signal recognition particle-docking protein FtsY [Bacillota bacterium]
MTAKSLFAGLERARRGFWGRLGDLAAGRRPVDDDLWDQLEESLVASDMGTGLALEVLAEVRRDLPRRADADQLWSLLAVKLKGLLGPPVPLVSAGKPGEPAVIAVVGVNGTGKTTTIGKLAHRFVREGAGVVLGAGDTFRAAAAEQLAIWGQRAGAQVVAHKAGADPAAVAFDAIQAAIARRSGVVILDTAGRLHTRQNLMEELRKVLRVSGKAMPGAPHEVLLVIDAPTGGNAVEQARTFREACAVTGVVLTKLDGTARGGTVFRIRRELDIPIKLVGTGEKLEDLMDFEPGEFVKALLQPVTGGNGK